MRFRTRRSSRLLRLTALVLLSSAFSLANAEGESGTPGFDWICKALHCAADSVTSP